MSYKCTKVNKNTLWLVNQLCADSEAQSLMAAVGLDSDAVRAALSSPLLRWQDMTSQMHVVQLSPSQQQQLMHFSNQIVPTRSGDNRVDSNIGINAGADVQVGNLLREFWCAGGTPKLPVNVIGHVANELRLSKVSVRLSKAGNRSATGVHFDILTEPSNIAGDSLTPLELSVSETLCCSLQVGTQPIHGTLIVRGLFLPILQSLRGDTTPEIRACMEYADVIFDAIISGLYRWMNDPDIDFPFEMWEVPAGAVVNLLGVMHRSPVESNRMFLHAEFELQPKYALRQFPDGGLSRAVCERSRTWGWRLALNTITNANDWGHRIEHVLALVENDEVTGNHSSMKQTLKALVEDMKQSSGSVKYMMSRLS
jgi:hypothetical protein